MFTWRHHTGIKLFGKRNFDSVCFWLVLLLEFSKEEILFQVWSLENQSNVVIRTADTDCLIIGLGCCEKLDPFLKIWLEVGCRVEIIYDLLVLILYTLIYAKISARVFPLITGLRYLTSQHSLVEKERFSS